MVAAGLGVSIVSAVTVRDQVQLGYLKIVAMRDVTIERTLWRLKLPGRIAMPAACVFEQMLDDRKTFPDEKLD